MSILLLSELLTQRNALLEKVLAVTRAQPDLIAQDNQDALLDNIALRQELIDALVELDKHLPESSARSRDAASAELEEQAHVLHQEIMTQDSENEALAQKRIEELQTQLRKLKAGKTAFSGYEKPTADPGATYFDTKQ